MVFFYYFDENLVTTATLNTKKNFVFYVQGQIHDVHIFGIDGDI